MNVLTLSPMGGRRGGGGGGGRGSEALNLTYSIQTKNLWIYWQIVVLAKIMAVFAMERTANM